MQQLGIVNSGGGIMSWSAYGDEPWILVTPGSGTLARGEVAYNDVIVDATGKAAGTYIGNVVISGNDAANTPQYIPVTMTILPTITIVSPNGGEVLSSGSSSPVTWNVNAPGQAVSNTVLTYTADGGTTWKPVRTLRGMASSYVWKVPTVAKTSSQCLVKVEFRDVQGAVIATDVSDAYFTMVR